MGLVKIVLSLVMVLLVVGAASIAAAIAGNGPPLSDPPGVWRRIETYLTQHVAQTAPDSEFPELHPQRFAGEPAAVLEAAAESSRTFGWDPVSVDAKSGSLTAVVTSSLWKFKDDLVVTVEADGSGHSVLNARSTSRVGRGDLGANARHVRELIAGVARRVPLARDEVGRAAGQD